MDLIIEDLRGAIGDIVNNKRVSSHDDQQALGEKIPKWNLFLLSTMISS